MKTERKRGGSAYPQFGNNHRLKGILLFETTVSLACMIEEYFYFFHLFFFYIVVNINIFFVRKKIDITFQLPQLLYRIMGHQDQRHIAAMRRFITRRLFQNPGSYPVNFFIQTPKIWDVFQSLQVYLIRYTSETRLKYDKLNIF